MSCCLKIDLKLMHTKKPFEIRRLEGTGVTTYSLTPGNVATEITRNVQDKPGFALANFFWKYVAKTPFYGAQTTLYCALAEELWSESGKYYDDCKEEKLLPLAASVKDQDRLWELSEKLVGFST